MIKTLTVFAYLFLSLEAILAAVIIIGLYSSLSIETVEQITWWFIGCGVVALGIGTIARSLEIRAEQPPSAST